MTGPTPDTADRIEHRFYGELARWWPLISPPEEYAEEAQFSWPVCSCPPPSLSGRWGLELGSGGGHNAQSTSRPEFRHDARRPLGGEMLDVPRAPQPGV